MSSQRDPLTESIDELLHRQGSDMPLSRYLLTRDGLRDWLCASLLAGICFGAAHFVVRANVF